MGALVVAVTAVGAWLAVSSGSPGSPDPEDPPAASSTDPGTSPSPTPPEFELRFDLRRVRGHSPSGEAGQRELSQPASAVGAAITELYSIGFVDTTRWRDGRFPALRQVFAAPLRDEVRSDLQRLTLGRTVRTLDAVRPQRARLEVDVLTDSRGRAVAAFATARFEGVGIAGDGEIPLWHEGAYTLRRTDGTWRIVAYDVRGRVPSPGEVRAERRDAVGWPGLPSEDPLFVLVIGSDARPGGPVARARADSLHIVALNPKQGRVSILGIPRDSLVPIPGVGTAKINEALSRGGPELMVRTVESLTGIPIDAYALTGFEGFEQLVAAIGGIDVNVPYPMSDPFSRAYFRAGPTKLSGREALAFARNRHDAPGGDFGRSLNQGRLMIAAFRELREELDRGQLGLIPWTLAGARHVRSNLSMTEMLDLLLAAPAIDPDRISNRVVSGHGAMVGGRSVVLLGGEAQAAFRDLARDGVLGG